MCFVPKNSIVFSCYSCSKVRFKNQISLRRKQFCFHYLKQAGTGPSRRHIQGSKIAKRLPSVKHSLLQYSKIKNFTKNFSKKIHTEKMDRVARRGPLARAPRAERGTLPKLSTFLSQLRGFSRKTKKLKEGKIFIFGKKSHSAEKN